MVLELKALAWNDEASLHPLDGELRRLNTHWARNGGAILQESIAYLHQDSLGSVETLSSESSALLQRLKFDPFGRRAFPHALSASASPVPRSGLGLGFTGHRHDDEAGLIDMRGRLYDAVVGRFLSPDPLLQAPGRSQSHNRYAYAWNNPLRYTDPTGYQVTASPSYCGNTPEEGCGESISVNGAAASAPLMGPYISWEHSTWHATGPDGRRGERGGGGGRAGPGRVTAGELMEMSLEQRRAFMQQAAPGLPMPLNFGTAEMQEAQEQFSDQLHQGAADMLSMLPMPRAPTLPPCLPCSRPLKLLQGRFLPLRRLLLERSAGRLKQRGM